jgi:hypothetical protein
MLSASSAYRSSRETRRSDDSLVANGMTLLTYDEGALVERLSVLDRRAKTAFAASCAQRLLPFFEPYAHAVGRAEWGERLRTIVDASWDLASGAEFDVHALQAEAESMVPSDEGEWITEMGYAQNAAAAAAYAIRTSLTDDPQEAAWAGRQVYELADYAVQCNSPEIDMNHPEAEAQILGSAAVQRILAALDNSLKAIEAQPPAWTTVRAEAETDSQLWIRILAQPSQTISPQMSGYESKHERPMNDVIDSLPG